MPFESRSLDAKSPFASAVALRRVARRRNSAASFGSAVIERSVGQIRPSAESGWPASHPAPPPDPDLLWRWLCKAASWLLTLAIEGFAQYGNAMYPGLYHPKEYGDGYAQTVEPTCEGLPSGQHEDDCHLASSAFNGDAAAKLSAFAGSKKLLAVAPDRRTRTAARLVKLFARWRREAEARRQAALLSRFSDHLLRDIGLARDQIAGYTHHEYYGE
jgi:uncharacterized protein YjiS (DUF1127 family)